jgi:EmrB/QacA subfamily drug resistance transporter
VKPARGEPEPGFVAAEAELAPVLTPPLTSRLLPIIIGSALFMQTLDGNVISNALPTMAVSLHRDPLTLNLAITAYLLAAAVFLPISGWLADQFGAKTVFRIAIVGFALSSLACGLSQTFWELIAARMLQGVAGAMMSPVGRLVLLRSVPKGELIRAMSYLTMPALLGPVLGPPIGGFIVTFLSWRWIFFINLPIGLAGVVLTGLFVPNIREPSPLKLDVRGLVLTGLGLAGFAYGFENLGRGLFPLAVLLGGGASLALYGLHFRSAANPILNLRLLGVPTFRAATVGGLFSRMANGATPFLLALLLQLGFGLSAFHAGLLTFIAAVGAILMKTTAGPILKRFGFRRVLIFNGMLTAAIFASYALFRPTTPHWLLMGTLLVGGFVRSLQFTSLNSLAYADVPQGAMSQASSFSSVFQQLSQSLGIGAAALLIHLTLTLQHGARLTTGAITPAFAIIAAISLIGLLFFIPLRADAGREVSNHAPA